MRSNTVLFALKKRTEIRSAAAGLIFLFGMMFLPAESAHAQNKIAAEAPQQFWSVGSFSDEAGGVQSLRFSNEMMVHQPETRSGLPHPGRAMLRSFVLPGWGQYYADSSHWRRGQFHLGADLILLGSLVYLSSNASILQNNIYTYARTYAGIDLRTVPRNVELAVASSNSLSAFNETQLRSRNWDRLIDDIPQNRWQWQSEENRGEFLQMRDRKDRAERQIPALVTLMVVNRVVSGVHAFITARNLESEPERFQLGVGTSEVNPGSGYQATLRIRL